MRRTVHDFERRTETGTTLDAAPVAVKLPPGEFTRALRGSGPLMVLFLGTLGGMYFGWFSPTEGAAVGAFGAVTLAALSGRLTRRALFDSVRETATTSGMIFVILIGAGIFNAFIESTQMTDAMIAAV